MKLLRFSGIGEASAAVVMAALAANPSTLVLTQGFAGKVVFFFLKIGFMALASLGLIVLNVGSAKIETIVTSNKFDGSWDTAEKLIKEIQDSGRTLTPEEIKKIDGPVIAAFRKFASFGRPKKGLFGGGP